LHAQCSRFNTVLTGQSLSAKTHAHAHKMLARTSTKRRALTKAELVESSYLSDQESGLVRVVLRVAG